MSQLCEWRRTTEVASYAERMPTKRARLQYRPAIVYVEDNHGDAILLKDALDAQGLDVELVVIEKGDTALHYFKVKAEVRDIPPPHCILLDSNLPIVTGSELLKYLRGAKEYNDTPIYIFASETEHAALSATLAVSRESFLTKPSNWKGFLALADLLMKSAVAKDDHTAASPLDSNPEVHAEGALRQDE